MVAGPRAQETCELHGRVECVYVCVVCECVARVRERRSVVPEWHTSSPAVKPRVRALAGRMS